MFCLIFIRFYVFYLFWFALLVLAWFVVVLFVSMCFIWFVFFGISLRCFGMFTAGLICVHLILGLSVFILLVLWCSDFSICSDLFWYAFVGLLDVVLIWFHLLCFVLSYSCVSTCPICFHLICSELVWFVLRRFSSFWSALLLLMISSTCDALAFATICFDVCFVLICSMCFALGCFASFWFRSDLFHVVLVCFRLLWFVLNLFLFALVCMPLFWIVFIWYEMFWLVVSALIRPICVDLVCSVLRWVVFACWPCPCSVIFCMFRFMRLCFVFMCLHVFRLPCFVGIWLLSRVVCCSELS